MDNLKTTAANWALKCVFIIFVYSMGFSDESLIGNLDIYQSGNAFRTRNIFHSGNQESLQEDNVTKTSCSDSWLCDNGMKSYPFKGCFCDDLCGIMNDCCSNHIPNDTDLLGQFNEAMFACLSRPNLSNSTKYYVLLVSKCPPEENDTEIKQLCEHTDGIPVIGNREGIVYKNPSCARCHGKIGDLMKWQTDIKKKFAGVTQQKYVFLSNEANMPIKLGRTLRACANRRVKDYCQTSVDKELCKSGDYAIVYDAADNMYKNRHCALCNRVRQEDIRCTPTDKELPDERTGDGYMDIADVNQHSRATNESGDTSIKQLHDSINEYATTIGLIVSITSLVLTLMTYAIFPRLRTEAGKITICLVSSMLLAQSMYLIIDQMEDNYHLCKWFAVLSHYFLLTSFCWMNVMAFDIYRTFSKKTIIHTYHSHNKRKLLFYILYAQGLPLIFVLTPVTLNILNVNTSFNPKYGKSCWLSTRNSKILFFIGPLSFFKLFDLVAFVKTVTYIIRTKRQTSIVGNHGGQSTYAPLICIKLSVIMGLSWILAFIANIADNEVVWLLFILLNTLHGLFIFLCFVCNRRVLDMCCHHYSRVKIYLSFAKANTTGTSI